MTINLIVPKSWAELNDQQLQQVYSILARDATAPELKARCMCAWSGLSILYRDATGYRVKHEDTEFTLSALQLAEVLPALSFLDTLPEMPRHLPRISKHTPLDFLFRGVPLEKFICADNFYQGYLHTQKKDLLLSLASILYDTEKRLPLKPWQEVAVFYFFAALKNYFAHRFSHFFRPAASESANLLGTAKPIGVQIQEAVDAMIRALTKGDITKEKQILSLDTWRALTELDAQAKEYDELKRQYPSK